jgi:phosphoserine phosphatase SerB
MNDKPKLIFFNLDGTLIDGMEYIYQHLWEYFGVDKTQTRETIQKFINNEIGYEEWVNTDLKLLQEAGATKQTIMDAIMSLHPMEGALNTIRALKNMGYKIVIVSGGIDLVIEAVYGDEATVLFDEVYINKYNFDAEGKLVGATPAQYGMEDKAACIKDMAAKYGVDTKDCVFVGDNENDVAAALTAGKSIAFNSKSERLVEVATNHVESNDLREILQFING